MTSEKNPTSQPALRRGTRRLWRSLITLEPAPGRWVQALGWAAAVAVGLLTTACVFGPAKGAMGLLGAMATGAGREAPLRRRLRQGFGAIFLTLACQAIGLAIAPYPWMVPLVMAVVTVSVVWLWHALLIGPPGPVNAVFAGAFGTYMGANGYGYELLVITALAWGAGMVGGLILLAFRPHQAEEIAVTTAESSVATFCHAAEQLAEEQQTAEPRGANQQAEEHQTVELSRANQLAEEQQTAAPPRANQQAEVHLPADHRTPQQTAGGGSPGIVSRETLPPDSLVDLRERAYADLDKGWHVLRTGRTPGTVPLSAEGRALEERLRAAHLKMLAVMRRQAFPASNADIEHHFNLVPLGLPSWRYLLRTAAQFGSRPILVAGRAATAVFIAGVAGLLSPVGHPYWAILSALIILQMGAPRADLTIRAAHRIVGTAAGVLVYFVAVSLHPGHWVELGIVIVAVYFMEAVVVRNYALAVTAITVFALLMTPVTSEEQILIVIRDRMVETVLGACAATLVIWLGSKRAPILLVRRQYRLTLNSLILCLEDIVAGRHDSTPRRGAIDPVRVHRRNLVFELSRASAILVGQRADAPVDLAEWTAIQREVSSFGYDVVAAAWGPTIGHDGPARALAAMKTLVEELPPISRHNINPAATAASVRAAHEDFLSMH